jgi:UDP-2,3-diacylglucosamine pyrophosphatase LpxH
MSAVVVSDLHIGSKYYLHQILERFLDNIPEDYELILNGDIVDNPYAKLEPKDQRILNRIEQISYRQKVVWLWGNHDNGDFPKNLGKIRVKHLHTIGNRLLITHGDYFDEIMPRSKAFMKAFELMHNLRIKLGARPMHVAEYAKKWEFFYKLLCKNVMINVVNYAKENGFEAVTCGHTHHAEDRLINGVRYINTGAWTEFPPYCLIVTTDEIWMRRIDEFSELPKSFRPEKFETTSYWLPVIKYQY